MGLDIFTQGNTSIERLIEATLRIESQPRFQYTDKKEQLNRRTAVLSDLDSKLSALSTVAKRLTDTITDHFAKKATASSETSQFTATADSTALVGNHDLTISRLAAADTRVSQQYTSTGTTLKTYFDSNGSQTFQIEVAHPTTDDSSNRETISVTINSSSATDDEVLDDIALAINNAMGSAVTAETIDADEKLVASVVHEEDGKSRLIFRSGQSGFTYRMVMTDSTNTLLSTLDINSASASSGTAGGYITTVGSSASDSSLNSELQMDGLTFYRDSNSISDIMDGVTLTLKDKTTTTEALKVSVDAEAVKAELQSLMDKYNDVISYLKAKLAVDPTTNERGALAGESTYSFVRSNLRNILTSVVSGMSSGNPSQLFEIGITPAADGTLSFTDSEKFETILAAGSNQISDLFDTTSTGIGHQIESFLQDFIKVGGIIDDSKDSIADRVQSLDGQIKRFDKRLGFREQQLRAQFGRMQQISTLLNSQFLSFASLLG